MTLSVVSGRGYLSPNRASGVAALRLGYGYRVGKDRKSIVQLQPYCSLEFTPAYDSTSKRFFFLFTGASLSIFFYLVVYSPGRFCFFLFPLIQLPRRLPAIPSLLSALLQQTIHK